MSQKTIKITNGKILNYTISAPGYKTIHGSELITADKIINKNMLAENDPNSVYTVGDRLGGIASFICYFNSTNPETFVDTKYAVFVLDAQYRTDNSRWGKNGTSGLPQYTNDTSLLSSKESATYNTTYILNKYEPSDYPAFNSARNAASINIEGNIYQAQLPNAFELQQIWIFRDKLDSVDPTLSNYPNYSLVSWGFPNSGYRIWTSNEYGASNAWCYLKDSGLSAAGSGGSGNKWDSNPSGVVPVFEIPIE